MGCDIHTHAERKLDDGTYEPIPKLHPWDWRSYGLYGFLADVRNYSAITPISNPRGLPPCVSEPIRSAFEDWGGDYHSISWLSVEELAAYDYDQVIEDRRVTINGDGGCTAEPGGGKLETLREFLGEGFFTELETLQAAGADRVVFGFDC